MRGLRHVQAAIRSGAEGPRSRRAARPARSKPIRKAPRSSTASSSFSAAKWPMSPKSARNSDRTGPSRTRGCASSSTTAPKAECLLRSFQRALTRTKRAAGSPPSAGPLFDQSDAAERANGTIYVLRSKSNHPQLAPHRDVMHKIGVTGRRCAPADRGGGARTRPTCWPMWRSSRPTSCTTSTGPSLRTCFIAFSRPARLDLEIKDRFGNPVKPREWFLVPLPVIDEAVKRIKDETIANYEYEPASASLKRRPDRRRHRGAVRTACFSERSRFRRLAASRRICPPSTPSFAPARPNSRPGRRRGGQRSPPRARAGPRLASGFHSPDLLRMDDAAERKPCAVISSCLNPRRRKAALIVFSLIGRSADRAEGNRKRPAPVMPLSSG